VCIDSMAISGRHCQILNILNDSFLEDLESTNGTFVNGNRVKKYALSDNDVIVVGRHHLKFNKLDAGQKVPDDDRTVAMGSGILDTFSTSGSEHEAPETPPPVHVAPPPQPAAPPPPQPVAPPPQPAPPPQQAAPPPQPAAPPPPQYAPPQPAAPAAPPPQPASPPGGQYGNLQLLNTSRAGRTMELTKAVTTIGKPGSQVAAISLRKDGYYIVVVDSGGGNVSPPTVNSGPLGNQVMKLNNNDVIEIAGVKLLFSS
ncbi:MAG: FHA domain-containing protein, partial [Proteobacteria bacterium]|nr:FHA domain-containing protein [Pseudomonadota bacterium]